MEEIQATNCKDIRSGKRDQGCTKILLIIPDFNKVKKMKININICNMSQKQ